VAKLGCVILVLPGGPDKEDVLKWPVVENKRAERGCRMRGRVLDRGP